MLTVAGAAAGSLLHYVYPIQVSVFVDLVHNFLLSLFAPPSTTTTELNAAYKGATTEDGRATIEAAQTSLVPIAQSV